jgi:glycosyltransferase involved in cell wall biosynthesis
MRKKNLRLLLFTEEGTPCRYWEGAIPLLLSSSIDLVFASVGVRGSLHDLIERYGCPAFSLQCRTSRDYLAAVFRLRRLLRDEAIDLIHASESIPAALSGMAGLMGNNQRLLFHRHHTFPEGRQALFSRIGSRLADRVMTCSRAAAMAAEQIDDVGQSRLCVAYNGILPMRSVDSDEIIALKRGLRISASTPVIAIVGRLRKIKGHRTLMDAVPMMAGELKKKPAVIFVGQGPEEEALKKSAKEIKGAMFHFVGHQEDVAPWFALADVIAMPSLEETFGLSAVEAMACGKPLVASNVGGLKEIVEDGTSGLLVEPNHPEDLAKAILKILLSPTVKARLRRGALRRADDFSMERMVGTWITCYQHTMASPRLGSRIVDRLIANRSFSHLFRLSDKVLR